jgi:DNA-binding NarL/FixJ family response regulator
VAVAAADAIAGDISCIAQHHVDAVTFHLECDNSEQWETYRLIAELFPSKPLIILANWMDTGGRSARRAFEMGCAAFVIEPCTPRAIAEIIQGVVSEGRQLERARGLKEDAFRYSPNGRERPRTQRGTIACLGLDDRTRRQNGDAF